MQILSSASAGNPAFLLSVRLLLPEGHTAPFDSGFPQIVGISCACWDKRAKSRPSRGGWQGGVVAKFPAAAAFHPPSSRHCSHRPSTMHRRIIKDCPEKPSCQEGTCRTEFQQGKHQQDFTKDRPASAETAEEEACHVFI